MVRMYSQGARKKILDAAAQVFADRSYEGSRIDEIARTAGVPKSLIYYHFDGKAAILEELAGNFIARYLELIEVARHDGSHQQKADNMTGRAHLYADFSRQHADLIRVLFIESLKKSSDRPVLFQVVEEMIKAEQEFPGSQSFTGYDPQERMVAEFFTNLIPLFAFNCFCGAWSSCFGMEPEALEALFYRVMRETHGAYHRNHR